MREIEKIIEEEVSLNRGARLEDTNNLAQVIEKYVIKREEKYKELLELCIYFEDGYDICEGQTEEYKKFLALITELKKGLK